MSGNSRAPGGKRPPTSDDVEAGKPPAATRTSSVRVGWRLDVDVTNELEAAAARFFAENVDSMRDRHLMRSVNSFAEMVVRFGLDSIRAADPEDVMDRMRPSRRW